MKLIKRDNGNDIKIFATTLEEAALEQIKQLGEFEAYRDSKIRIMPDCHAGAGCTIGTTMEIKDKITPNLVGVDIGCGMLTIALKETEVDLQKLDAIINEFVPNGFNIHSEAKGEFDFERLRAKGLNIERAKLSIGSLGGGNHFIEVGKSLKGELFLVIHSGSRNIGNQVAKFYQDIAIKQLTNNSNKDLAYLTGNDFENYMHDMVLMQKFATLNRRVIADIILQKANLTEISSFETIHNYIDFTRMILRKGAVSAEKGEILLIPINMRDGSIIAKGKGNADWNYSAPHGAGRLMGRREAYKKLNFDEFKEQMRDVYSTSVLAETLDEAPNAYKSMEEIIDAIGETAEIIAVIKPIYNFKAH